MKHLLIAIFCLISVEVCAQQATDTTKKKIVDTIKKDLFTAPDTVKKLRSKVWSFVPAAVAVSYGALSFAIHPIRRLDYYVQTETNKTSPNFHSKAENYFQYAPVAMVYGLNLVGVTGKNRFIDRTALLGLSAGILGITTFTTKKLTHRLRPNGADYYSFPSGHTANAFMGAEFIAQEYSEKSYIYTAIGYSFAVTTGVFRMYNRDHWFSDVVAGAGVGIISTKLSYLIYPYLRNALTHTDKKGKSAMLMPFYQDGVPGLSFAMQL
ncbi:phosphatase PAP2 family protein [Mucilaginibacter sp. UYCu711]|uniref:phosphatase PAP2 family protein n=1 Tax=Mucilaginibacter sp. UYCu711 TaxID=3156339 RepID=UPI003D1C4C6F